MRRFFIGLLVLSLLATAGAFYWRTYYPEHASAPATSSEPKARSLNRDADRAPSASSARGEERSPSSRQDLALNISILSSVISALAAVAQAWFTARSYRRP